MQFRVVDTWEIMLSQHAMHQPITGLGNDSVSACNQLTLPIKEPAEAQNDRRGEGRDFFSSLLYSFW